MSTSPSFIGAGHESNGFGFEQAYGIGLRVNTDDISLPPQIDIYLGLHREAEVNLGGGVPAWITELIERQDKPPVYHPPTCVIGCGPDLPPIANPTPEPATAALCMAALAIVGLRLMLRRGAR